MKIVGSFSRGVLPEVVRLTNFYDIVDFKCNS